MNSTAPDIGDGQLCKISRTSSTRWAQSVYNLIRIKLNVCSDYGDHTLYTKMATSL